MDGDRLTAAVERYILTPHENVVNRRDWPDSVAIKTNRGWYDAQPADWLIAREPWVDQAFRLVLDDAVEDAASRTFGLILQRDGGVLHVNDQATMRGLGSRLGDDLDPLAYAELLAEFYSGPDIDRPVVAAQAASAFTKAGWLVHSVDQILAEFPFLDPELLSPPSVRQVAGRVEITFHSCHYHLDVKGEVDVLRWNVAGGPGHEVGWLREYVARDVSRP
ncbi:hypothetical protein [Micromonospora sp. NPDC004704]